LGTSPKHKKHRKGFEMKKIFSLLLAVLMLLSLCACDYHIPLPKPDHDVSTQTTTDTSEQEASSELKTNFDSYTCDFGKTYTEVSKTYETLPFLDGWLGVLWYRIGNKHMLGFDGGGIDSEGNAYDYEDSILVAAQVPIWDVYPDIYKIADDAGYISQSDFANYIQENVEYAPLYEDEFSSPYLYYSFENLNVMVFCDENGNINVDEAQCQFFMKQ